MVIGIIGGDGIGPAITEVGRQVLEELLSDEVAAGKVEFRNIEGLTIENRAGPICSRSPTTCWRRSRPATLR